MSIRSLVENKTKLDYQALTTSLIGEFGITDPVNWEAVIPANVQQNLFGGETLRLFSDHPNFATQKDIRTIVLKKGQTSQLLILFAKLKNEKLSKPNIEKVTKKFIGGSAAERFVVWFIGNPSNTEFKVVLSGKEGKRIVLKTLPFGVNQPYYKTYDFILDEVHKKVSQFFVEPNELWQALWKSFDISVVNKKFYLDIKSAFDSLINDPVFKGSIRIEEARKQFAVRLIGRIIFCWFLKKKDIVSETVLSSNAISQYENYYFEFLEKLFFEVFNTPKKERGKLPNEIKDYPFLNGGLFEAQDGDYGDYQGKVIIDNEWFLNLFKNTLEKYNFTIDENTSSSSEIAIDPEMLGRIFENLLAEQNPDTQESARKSTGSYYTPREIVDYMVEQSISEYLKSNIAQDVIASEAKQSIEQIIEDFVHTEEFPEELKPYSEEILDKLNSVKVLDPACGSGAFPIGMLQKLIALKLQLSPLERGQRGVSVYDLKLQTILNSIYGCDIQPMAVELSRLRCWLSLIIDEEVDKKKENWGIANLPNLDFKFVCVNTLIGLPKMLEDSLGTSADDFEKLKQLREEFFTASAKRKLQIEKEFKELQDSIAIKQREWSTKNTKAVTMLVNWNPFKVEKTDWLDPFWMFGIKDGFNIAIANPPYINIENLKEDIKEYLYSNYETCKGRTDIYIAFIDRALSLLTKEGILSFIIPYAFTNQKYGTLLRKKIIENYHINEILDTSEFFVFEAIVKNIVILVSKAISEKETIIKSVTSYTDFYENKFLIHQINQLSFLKLKDFRLETKQIINNLSLKEKISISTLPFGEICFIAYGARLNHRSKSIKKDFYLHQEFKSGYKPFLEGKNIDRYYHTQNGWLNYKPDEHYNSMFPELFENDKIIFINVVKEKLRFSLDNQHFYNSHTVINCVLWFLLKRASHTSVLRNINQIRINQSSNYDYKYLLSVLNSNLINWYFLSFLSEKLHFYPDDAKQLPIKILKIDKQKPFIELVDKILAAKQQNPQANTKHLEDQIDIMVYKLYNLTYEEVEIIEPKIGEIISKADYDKFQIQ